VDQAGQPLTPLLIWADNRASDVAARHRASPHAQDLYERTGLPIHPMSPFCKVQWLARHQPAVFAQAHKFIGIKEYVFHHFFGHYLVDHSLASATGLFSLAHLDWDELALAQAGIGRERLSECVPPQHAELALRPGLAAQMGIPPRTPFFVGGSDGCLANLGSGVVGPGRMAVTVGTSGAVRIASPGIQTDPLGRTFCYVLADGLYVVGGGMNNGGVVLDWWRAHFAPAQAAAGAVDQVPPGSDGLLCLPYLFGERAPRWNADARGVFFGVAPTHTHAHFTRACMEGVVMALYSIANILDQRQFSHEVYASGGFAHSPLWVQVLADVFGKPVYLAESVESSALGAALIAMKATGAIGDLAEAAQLVQPTAEYRPQPAHHEVYQAAYQQFERLYQLLAPAFWAGPGRS
jgi:gluconokinase